MRIPRFAMERMQSTYENLVDYNLSESGVHPMRVEELDRGPGRSGRPARPGAGLPPVERHDRAARARCGDVPGRDGRPHRGDQRRVRGELRHHVAPDRAGRRGGQHGAELRPDAGPGRGVRRHPETVAAAPRSRRPPLARSTSTACAGAGHRRRRSSSSSATRTTRPARASRRPTWTASARSRAASARGCSPTRSTAARRSDGVETPSVWGRYDRVIITSGLSKAYGLPGLRIGWIASTPRGGRHDVGATTTTRRSARARLSDRLARIALQPAMRAKILARTRRSCTTNLPVIIDWLDAHADRFSYALPEAGAIVYVRYHDAINSTALVDRLRVEKSVLIVPGDHFGMDGYLRIGFGSETRYLRDGLDRLDHLLRDLPAGARSDVARWSTWICCSSGSATSASASRGCSRRSPCALRARLRPELARGRHRDAAPRLGLRRPRPRPREGAEAHRGRRVARRPHRRGERAHARAGRLGARPHQARHGRSEGSAACSTS